MLYIKADREELLPDILYRIGELYLEKMKDKESALKNYKRVVAEYPESKMSVQAAASIAELENNS